MWHSRMPQAFVSFSHRCPSLATLLFFMAILLMNKLFNVVPCCFQTNQSAWSECRRRSLLLSSIPWTKIILWMWIRCPTLATLLFFMAILLKNKLFKVVPCCFQTNQSAWPESRKRSLLLSSIPWTKIILWMWIRCPSLATLLFFMAILLKNKLFKVVPCCFQTNQSAWPESRRRSLLLSSTP